MPSRKSRATQSVLITHDETGFTLIELMVVVVILSIFAGMMTMSVGSTESRKNRAFYEHLLDSLSYVRLVSAERMQPMGLVLQPDKQGQAQPVIVSLSNPYAHFENQALASNDNAKNSMELSAMNSSEQTLTPSWNIETNIDLPTLPANVVIDITPLDNVSNNTLQTSSNQLQPWFVGTDVPQALWFGTGEAAPVIIEVKHNERLVGDVITLLPDGRIVVGE